MCVAIVESHYAAHWHLMTFSPNAITHVILDDVGKNTEGCYVMPMEEGFVYKDANLDIQRNLMSFFFRNEAMLYIGQGVSMHKCAN